VFLSSDGVRFAPIELPDGAGDAQDVAIDGETVFVLTARGLYRSRGARFEPIADAPTGDPFGRFEPFCSAPLTAFDGALFAGSTRDGRLYRLVAR
jgi:hypothetical protein